MSLHIAKLFKNPLALAGAALVIHIGAATAADSTGDIQQQMRDLLAGTITVHSAPQSGARHDKVTARTVPTDDVQQQMRDLLAGTIIARFGPAIRTARRQGNGPDRYHRRHSTADEGPARWDPHRSFDPTIWTERRCTGGHGVSRSYDPGAQMRTVSERAIVMRPLLAALASLSLFSQLCMSGCAVGPSYRRPATTLEDFHSVGAHAARPDARPCAGPRSLVG